MFSITVGDDGEIHLSGRFDASRVEQAEAVFSRVTNTCHVNFSELQYISSAGLGVSAENAETPERIRTQPHPHPHEQARPRCVPYRQV